VGLKRLRIRSLIGILFAATLVTAASVTMAQSRLGGTFFPKAADGGTRRFPGVAYDSANDAYLVVWGLGQVGARFVSPGGSSLGSAVVLNSVTGGAARVACASALNACLVAWVEEPASIMGRMVRYNGGAVQTLTAPFAINRNGRPKLSSAAAVVTYSPVANEFLVAWTQFPSSGPPDVKAQRLTGSGALTGAEISVAITTLWEGLPSVAYNSVQNEYLVGYYFETGSGVNAVGAQRVKAGTGALIGTRSTLYSSGFEQYPEVAYDSTNNRYLAITWGFSGSSWMLRGRLADGNAQPLGAGTTALAVKGGGDGIGLSYDPVGRKYLGVFLSQTNAEIWGVGVSAAGAPGSQFQVTSSGTRLATQPRAAASTAASRWLTVASEGYTRVMAQLVQPSGGTTSTPPPTTSSCTTVQPASNWTCVNGGWLPPTSTSGGTTSSCTSVKPASNWVCVSGNWLPPTSGGTTGGTTSSCTSVKPASNWVCVNGNWLPPTSGGTTTSSCTTVKPASNWVCVSGNWLPPTSTCTTVRPASNWTCVNGNWLPPTTTTSSCTTVKPASNWVCVSGNWLPPTSSCTTVKPGDGWTCVNGGWLPPGY
jgi:hypothetical protein